MMRPVIALLFFALTACEPPNVVTVFPAAETVGKQQTVFVSTTRVFEKGGEVSNDRTADSSYFRYEISIPPQHEAGKVDWPRSRPDPERHMLTTEFQRFDSQKQFSANLAKSLRNRPKGQREVVVFIHGFNTSYAKGIYRLAQLSNDLGLQGPTVHYSWPSANTPLGYGHDRDSALFARDGLEALLHSLKDAGADKILLFGHSLGASLTVETLRQISISGDRSLSRLISGVILDSPDIDIDLFRRQVARIDPFPQPFVIFSSKKDRALRLAARLSGTHQRLGNVDDVNVLADLQVTLIDVSSFDQGKTGHFNLAKSPALLKVLRRMKYFDGAYRNDPSTRLGLINGTVLTVKKATQIVLLPIGSAAQ